MSDPQYTFSDISAAVHAGADLVQGELDLGERDQDLIHLIVKAAMMHLDNPDTSFDDLVRDTFDRLPDAVPGVVVIVGVTPVEDLRLRWLPSRRSVRHARALLATEPAADVALVPLYQPGKQYGIWLVGQPVTTVPGVVFLAATRIETGEGIPSVSWARNAACLLARERLRADGRGGTVAYAVVRHDSMVVFEDFGDDQ